MMRKSDVFDLQVDLIKRYFPRVKPRRIRLVDFGGKYQARAGSSLEIDKNFLKTCTGEELEDVLKHELVHYSLPRRHWHSSRFLRECRRVGIKMDEDGPEYSSWYEEGRFIGVVEERSNQDGTITFIQKRKPVWELFREGTLYNYQFTGRVFKTLRKMMCLTQKEVAGNAGMSVNMVRRIEKAKSVMLFNTKDLKRYFCACIKDDINRL